MDQTIFRNARPETGYTQISSLLLNEPDLSAEALALAVAVISKPLDWNFGLAWARQRFGWGETKSEHVVRELISRGFVRKRPRRGGDGTWKGVVYEFTDVPFAFRAADIAGAPIKKTPNRPAATANPEPRKLRRLQTIQTNKLPPPSPPGGRSHSSA